MAGNLSVETCGSVFQSRQASTQYGVGTDGRIGQYVLEKDRAWSTGNPENDKQSINIEVANDKTGGDWHVSDRAIASLIELMVDRAKANGIDKLIYDGTKNGNVTTHDMFMATACPGPYLKSKIPYIVNEVNKRLTAKEETKADELYRVRKSWSDASSQIGAYAVLDNAKKVADQNKGYYVFNAKGEAIYPPKAVETKKTNVQLACEVWAGKHGSGEARKKSLGSKYKAVQALVDKYVGQQKTPTIKALADEVLAGLWGKGSARRINLTNAGFDYDAVQAEVNRRY